MKKKKLIPYGRQYIDDRDIAEVVKVLKSDFVTQGPTIERFENRVAEFCGVQYAVAFSSGTAALHGACFAAGIKSGDEVITTPMTFAASANCILYCGGIPVFADIKKNIPLIDPTEIEKKITSRTKAIIPVDFAGVPADYDEIGSLAKKHNLILIADGAHSLGATYRGRKVGTIADMTMFSFHPVKTITTGEGGMIVTNNKIFYERLKMFRTHGITKDKSLMHQKSEGPWFYEMQELGYHYRMTDIQAALGLSQMRKINKFLKRRSEIVQIYYAALKNKENITVLETPKDRTSAYHLFPILVKNTEIRKMVVEKLHKQGIMVQVHYIPVHLHAYYQRNFQYSKGDFIYSEDYYGRVLSLPLFPQITNNEVKVIILKVKRALLP